MEILRTIAEIRSFSRSQRANDTKVGLVPTMGALHEGHMTLIDRAISQGDATVCSIFVNPAQFNNPDDLSLYPRREKEDLKLLSGKGCHAVFIPESDEIYPRDTTSLSMNFGVLEKELEGEFRPGHFSGVGLIVSKLFNAVEPQVAYFGKKDLQQLAIVRKLTHDLNFDIRIEAVETVRESSGLALSSRNLRLDKSQKETAAVLYKGLLSSRDAMKNGKSIKSALTVARQLFANVKNFELEYIEVVDTETFEKVREYRAGQISICAAAIVHGVRIIDNIQL